MALAYVVDANLVLCAKGVGLFIPNGFLSDGSVVEVELRGFGTIRNQIVFD